MKINALLTLSILSSQIAFVQAMKPSDVNIIKTDGISKRLAWSPNDQYIASSNSSVEGATIAIYDAKTGSMLKAFTGYTFFNWLSPIQKIASVKDTYVVESIGDQQLILAKSPFAVSPNGSFIAFASGMAFMVYNLKTAKRIKEEFMTTHSNFITWLDNNTVLLDTLRTESIKSPPIYRKIDLSNVPDLAPGGSFNIESVQTSPNRELLAVGLDDQTVRVVSAANGKELQVLKQESTINSISWSPDNVHIIIGLGSKDDV